MASGGTGSLPPFRAGGTGNLGGAPKADRGKKGDPTPSTVPQELLDKTSKNIGDWYSTPGKHETPPNWLVDQVADDILAKAEASGAKLNRDQVKAVVKERVKAFAAEHLDKDPSAEEIKGFADSQLAEATRGFAGNHNDHARIPIV